MDCRVNFTLDSTAADGIVPRAPREEYKMSCSDAVDFLTKLDPIVYLERYPWHKVKYNIKTSEGVYFSDWETPGKAAAKIELFMKNPEALPK